MTFVLLADYELWLSQSASIRDRLRRGSIPPHLFSREEKRELNEAFAARGMRPRSDATVYKEPGLARRFLHGSKVEQQTLSWRTAYGHMHIVSITRDVDGHEEWQHLCGPYTTTVIASGSDRPSMWSYMDRNPKLRERQVA